MPLFFCAMATQASELDAKIRDIHTRISKERKMIEGFRAMSQATSNPDTQKSCQSKIRDSEKSIQWFEQSLRDLQKKRVASSTTSLASTHASSSTATSSMGSQAYSNTSDGVSAGSSSNNYASNTNPSLFSRTSGGPPSASSGSSANTTPGRKGLPPTPSDGYLQNMQGPDGRQAGWAGGNDGSFASHSLSIRKRPNYTHLGEDLSANAYRLTQTFEHTQRH